MKKYLTLILVIRACFSLIPKPKSFTSGDQIIQIDDPCSIKFDLPDEALKEITENYMKITFPKFVCSNKKQFDNQLNFDITIGNELGNNKEGYRLKIEQERGISVYAESYVGYIRALDTFSQLVDYEDGKYMIKQTPIDIKDEPSFEYRGIMIDTSRHFLSVQTILKTIDGMMMNKLNYLHWHITDNESFPLLLLTHPELSQGGSYSQKEVYSFEDIKLIVEYAKVRGVQIIPEIDTPGHTLSWGYNEKLNKVVMKCDKRNGQFNPTLDLTYQMMKEVMNEVYQLFVDSPIFHFGGDEVDFDCWSEDEQIKQFMQDHSIETAQDLQYYYQKRQKSIWRDELKVSKPVAYWAFDDIQVDDDDIIHWWGNTSYLSKIAQKTNKIILSNYDFLYLDKGFGNKFGNSYGNFITWKDIYLKFDPYPENIKGQIIGGEACLWGELNSESTHFNKLFVRSSVLASILWNPDRSEELSTYVDRLVAQEHRMIVNGFEVSPVTSDYCSQNTQVCFPE